MRRPLSAVAVTLALASGCMPIPARYQTPPRTYAPRQARVSVGGFNRREFRQTSGGAAVATWDGRAAGSATLVAHGPAGSAYGQSTGAATWDGFAAASTWAGYYQPVSDAVAFKSALENTRCARVVATAPPATDGVALIGETHVWQQDGIVNHVVNTIGAFTYGLLGLPGRHVVHGIGRAREFRGEQYAHLATGAMTHPVVVDPDLWEQFGSARSPIIIPGRGSVSRLALTRRACN